MEILVILLGVLVAALVVITVVMSRLLGKTILERDGLVRDYDTLRRKATTLASKSIAMRHYKSALSMGVIRQHELRAHETTTNAAIDDLGRHAEQLEIHLGLRQPRAVVPDHLIREVGPWTP